MSSEDDVAELRDVVVKTLESDGTLDSLRAQLRASIFLALSKDNNLKNRKPLLKVKAKALSNTPEGRICLGLVFDLLQSLDLKASLAVLQPEVGELSHPTSLDICEDLGLDVGSRSQDDPILLLMVKKQLLDAELRRSITPQLSLDSVRSVKSSEHDDSNKLRHDQPPTVHPLNHIDMTPLNGHSGRGDVIGEERDGEDKTPTADLAVDGQSLLDSDRTVNGDDIADRDFGSVNSDAGEKDTTKETQNNNPINSGGPDWKIKGNSIGGFKNEVNIDENGDDDNDDFFDNGPANPGSSILFTTSTPKKQNGTSNIFDRKQQDAMESDRSQKSNSLSLSSDKSDGATNFTFDTRESSTIGGMIKQPSNSLGGGMSSSASTLGGGSLLGTLPKLPTSGGGAGAVSGLGALPPLSKVPPLGGHVGAAKTDIKNLLDELDFSDKESARSASDSTTSSARRNGLNRTSNKTGSFHPTPLGSSLFGGSASPPVLPPNKSHNVTPAPPPANMSASSLGDAPIKKKESWEESGGESELENKSEKSVSIKSGGSISGRSSGGSSSGRRRSAAQGSAFAIERHPSKSTTKLGNFDKSYAANEPSAVVNKPRTSAIDSILNAGDRRKESWEDSGGSDLEKSASGSQKSGFGSDRSDPQRVKSQPNAAGLLTSGCTNVTEDYAPFKHISFSRGRDVLSSP